MYKTIPRKIDTREFPWMVVTTANNGVQGIPSFFKTKDSADKFAAHFDALKGLATKIEPNPEYNPHLLVP